MGYLPLQRNFNTSNVTILHTVLGVSLVDLQHFNTSNVTILRTRSTRRKDGIEFQYIKCYYSTSKLR